jgi:gliding motility-associated-like protein
MYTWNTGSNAISITTDSTGTYIVTGTDMNGCSSSDTVMITSENPDSITVSSTILTPNYDGVNETLVINNISAYSSCDLKVYNMWNDLVYSVTGYKNDWTGIGSNGKQVPDGPYYYIIQCDDKPVLKGNINIILR